jgi:hypothetical protein
VTETTSPQPSTASEESLHPSEVPALVDALEKKVVIEQQRKAFNELRDLLDELEDSRG